MIANRMAMIFFWFSGNCGVAWGNCRRVGEFSAPDLPMSFKPTRTALYQQVTEHLRREIAAKEPGARLEPEHQMARRFSVSVITVREALRILTSEGRIARHPGRGTFVLPPEKVSTGRHVAILIDEDVSHPQSSQVYLRIAQALRARLAEAGVGSRLYVGQNPPGNPKPELNSPEFLVDLEAGKIGAVAALLAQPSSSWVPVAERQSLPVVGFGGNFPAGVLANGPFFPPALEVLKGLGCRRVAALTWFGFITHHAERVEAFNRLVSEHGLETRPEWVQYGENPSVLGAGWEAFRTLWMAYPEKPDALIISDDMLFKGFLPAVSELRLNIPEDLHVVVRTNKDVGILYPFPITRFELDPKAVAEALAGKLQQLLRGEALEEPLTLVPHVLLKENVLTGSKRIRELVNYR